jgi:hypothetical protein
MAGPNAPPAHAAEKCSIFKSALMPLRLDFKTDAGRDYVVCRPASSSSRFRLVRRDAIPLL